MVNFSNTHVAWIPFSCLPKNLFSSLTKSNAKDEFLKLLVWNWSLQTLTTEAVKICFLEPAKPKRSTFLWKKTAETHSSWSYPNPWLKSNWYLNCSENQLKSTDSGLLTTCTTFAFSIVGLTGELFVVLKGRKKQAENCQIGTTGKAKIPVGTLSCLKIF